MKRLFANKLMFFLLVLFLSAFTLPSFAEQSVEELKAQIQQLQERVEELESKQQIKAQENNQWSPYPGSSIHAWDPFAEVQRMQEEMNRMFQHSFNNRGWSNGGLFSNTLDFEHDFDLKENENEYEIKFDMTGFDQDKVDIQIDEHSITVKAEKSRREENKQDDGYFSTQSFGSFMRTIPVPADADTAKVKTEKKDQSLIIHLPKKTT